MRVKNNEIRIKIKEIYIEVLEQLNSKLLVPELSDEVLLLESGLDSLGFAILIATQINNFLRMFKLSFNYIIRVVNA